MICLRLCASIFILSFCGYSHAASMCRPQFESPAMMALQSGFESAIKPTQKGFEADRVAAKLRSLFENLSYSQLKELLTTCNVAFDESKITNRDFEVKHVVLVDINSFTFHLPVEPNRNAVSPLEMVVVKRIVRR